MKISVSWLFDYINYDKSKVDINKLVSTLNKKVAEVDSFKKVEIDFKCIFFAKVKEVNSEATILYIPELDISISLSFRSDVQPDNFYLIKKVDESIFEWALCKDLGCEKDSILPAFYINEKSAQGDWKRFVEGEDYILDISNTSITHRPDLWGHRGFAREVAIALGLNLKPTADLFEKVDVSKTTNNFARNGDFEIYVQDFDMCPRLSALYIENVSNVPSLIDIAFRLARVDSKPINSIVDVTNYVMLDLGQPMHAFDANFFSNKLFVRKSQQNEKITLLDGETVSLESDCVVATEDKIASLAGIMGGFDSGVKNGTTKIILESACFDASIIRQASIRLKKRTESSARYEKTLNPNNTIDAIKRFVHLFKKHGLVIDYKGSILSVGQEAKAKEIILDHEFIEKKLGISIDQFKLLDLFESIGFEVVQDASTYKIIVPPSRAVKDLTMPEDIVEEVIRFYGYENINYEMPQRFTTPHNISSVLNLRNLKNYMAYSASMMELSTYPFFDEEFLNEIGYKSTSSIEVVSPQSQNWKRAINTLAPNMLKAVKVNLHKANELRFFEVANIWKNDQSSVLEKKILAGVFFAYSKDFDFYLAKSYIQNLFDMFAINITWTNSVSVDSLFDPYVSADILVSGAKIGYLAQVKSEVISKFSNKGSALIFEIELDGLFKNSNNNFKFKPLSKYQEVFLDVSFMAPISLTVSETQEIIKYVDELIVDVKLIDSFKKKDWPDKKSMTFRYMLQSNEKTLTKEEIDSVKSRVEEKLISVGAEIR